MTACNRPCGVALKLLLGLTFIFATDLSLNGQEAIRGEGIYVPGHSLSPSLEGKTLQVMFDGVEYDRILKRDFWEYNPVTDTWTRIVDFPGTARCVARAYVVGSAAYIVAGYGGNYEKDMCRFTPIE